MEKEINGMDDIIQVQMDLLFDSVVELYELESGDISPYLQARLDLWSDELFKIMLEFVRLNQQKQ